MKVTLPPNPNYVYKKSRSKAKLQRSQENLDPLLQNSLPTA